MESIKEIQKNFSSAVLTVATFNGNSFSTIPTFLFMFNSFLLIHRFIHRKTLRYSKWKKWFYREFTFQWAYFYILRIWFVLLRTLKWCSTFLKVTSVPKTEFSSKFWTNEKVFSFFVMFLLTALSFLPFLILISRFVIPTEVPNFLMWIGEDPWIRSEMGISGHYLQRPPHFTLPSKRYYPFRCGRSISASYLVNITKTDHSSYVLNKTQSALDNVPK